MNVMRTFKSLPPSPYSRRRRSHNHHHYASHILQKCFTKKCSIHKLLEMHHICTKLFSPLQSVLSWKIPWTSQSSHQNVTLFSPWYRLIIIHLALNNNHSHFFVGYFLSFLALFCLSLYLRLLNLVSSDFS